MHRILTASCAALCLFALATVSHAQSVNVNRIVGNGNSVTNRSTGSGATANITSINGNGNRVVNSTTSRGGFAGGPTVISPGFRPIVVGPSPIGGFRPIGGGTSVNFNQVLGNGNRIINSSTGSSGFGPLGGSSVNLNQIRGNGNTIVNRR